MIKHCLFIIVFLILSRIALPQTDSYRINVTNKPLNKVLVELRGEYGIQLSYSDSKLASYLVTLSGSFTTEEKLIQALLKGTPFVLKKVGRVYVILPEKQEKQIPKPIPVTQISGQVLEAGSGEPLPFSHVFINHQPLVSDVLGRFTFSSTLDTSFHLRISHLGYFVFDTTLFSGIDQTFSLVASTERLPEIVVQNNIVEKAAQMGDRPGKIQLNHTIADVLPGQGDNAVFNLIRLMPGVLASGEQATDLLIWGSYEGQSQVIFDGFTLFGLKNYNDNISVVNPFLVKNIEIFKGGFDARYGDRVGGLVNITGKNGNLQKPVFSLNVNPTTVNALLEVPSFGNSSVMVAYRQTYYNLYASSDFNIFAPVRTGGKGQPSNGNNRFSFDFDVYPEDYFFQDFNMKYSASLNEGDQLFLSVYGGGDRFIISAETELERAGKGPGGRTSPYNITFFNKEYNQQLGGSLAYNRTWSGGNHSLFSLAHSGLSKRMSDEAETEDLVSGAIYHTDRASVVNKANENILRNDNTFHFLNGHKLEAGGSLAFNDASLSNSIFMRDTLRMDTTIFHENSRITLYAQDHLPLGEKWVIKTGLRFNYQFRGERVSLEPRLSLSYKPAPSFTLNASWGMYNQFMYKIANVDADLNYTWLWVTSTDRIPVLRAMHFVFGCHYFKKDLTLNVEAYYKPLRGLSRRVFENRLIDSRGVDAYYFYFGNARSYGIDAFVKKDFGKHSLWASYSLGWAEEQLSPLGIPLPNYSPAPHDQRHEVKLAGIYNVKNFYFSANYVWGSGMELLRQVFAETTGTIDYSRVDVALTYRFYPWGKKAEVGASVLNLFDTQNLKYANMKNINISREFGSISVYTNSVPFTPVVFLKVVI
ncbi:MAG TPA: TonB-dependent receptor [Prolixibacteraceae bacterium]|nr:TonB-dependent receptor [Prolixibacteraceae bacterium]